MTQKSGQTRIRWLYLGAALGLVLLALMLWSGWAELHPEQERQLRVGLQEQLEQRLPEAMRPQAGRYGIFPQPATDRVAGTRTRELRVLLVHGLDEPGGIWADLIPVLTAAGYECLEFRYPNDQAIDHSTDLLASLWPELPVDLPVVLIGHSMGGLVIRDFVSRWRHPVATEPAVTAAEVQGVILVGTPNQGSDWARLRVLLEPRDQWVTGVDSGFSPLAGLQDGTGAAKIDLKPGSDFLRTLNARPWPPAVPVQVIGGIFSSAAPLLGDGVVSADSLQIAAAPPPIMLAASHRGLLARLFESDKEPPAIPVILNLLDEMGSKP